MIVIKLVIKFCTFSQLIYGNLYIEIKLEMMEEVLYFFYNKFQEFFFNFTIFL